MSSDNLKKAQSPTYEISEAKRQKLDYEAYKDGAKIFDYQRYDHKRKLNGILVGGLLILYFILGIFVGSAMIIGALI